MDASIYPPSVVKIASDRIGRLTPDTSSPLSSSPNSPQRIQPSYTGDWRSPTPIQKIEIVDVDADVDVPDDEKIIKEEAAPFDEGLGLLAKRRKNDNDNDDDDDDAPDDEKKTDEGDELMGKGRMINRIDIELDEEEPPSLADPRRNRSPTKQPEIIDVEKIMAESSSLKTPAKQTRDSSASDLPSDEVRNLDKLRVNNDGIIPLPTVAATPADNNTINESSMKTPPQNLLSPPKVQKHKMWETSTDGLLGDSTAVVGEERASAIVSPSPDLETKHSANSNYEEDPVIHSPTKKAIMMSPNGEVEVNYVERAKSPYGIIKSRMITEFQEVLAMQETADNQDPTIPFRASQESGTDDNEEDDMYFSKYRQVHSEDYGDLTAKKPRGEESVGLKGNSDNKFAYNASLKGLEAKETSVNPFHPQGAVEIVAAPERVETPPTPGHELSKIPGEFSSTISDAVDLVASSANAVGDFVFGFDAEQAKKQQQEQQQQEEEQEEEQKKTSSQVNSTEAPATTLSSSTGKDWGAYLTNRGVGSTYSSSRTGDRKDSKKSQSTGYREMTPKKDMQSSEKSAGWLQEELKRRSIIKQEINDAILSRNAPQMSTHEEGFAKELAKALEALPPRNDSVDYGANIDGSNSVEDEEVAAITEEEPQQTTMKTSENDERGMGTLNYKSENDEMEKPVPRRLDYGSENIAVPVSTVRPVKPVIQSQQENGAVGSDNNVSGGRMNPIGDTTKILASQDLDGKTDENNVSLDSGLKEEMKRFASDTRAALREGGQPEVVNGESGVLNNKFRSIAISSSVGTAVPEDFHTIEVDASFNRPGSTGPAQFDPSIAKKQGVPQIAVTSSEGAVSEGSDFADVQNAMPVLVKTMDSVFGIAKGDITLSLLNENTGRVETSKAATWANRVRGAIWRCRRMRRSMGGLPSANVETAPGSPAKGRSSLPVDMDKARVAGGFRSVAATEEAALTHLKHDEVDEALELFEDIIFSYYSYFERSLKAREMNPERQNGLGTTDFKPYIGMALHNLGILNLLKGEYEEAVSNFSRAIEQRKTCLGEGHPDHISSLVKLAICRFAMNEFAEAHARLEEALDLVRRCCPTLEDRVQMAEILNNLGCLAYMCGQPVAAKAFFRDSLDVQFMALSESLYESSALMGQSISLNISITRANIGFVKLVTKDLPVAVTALENALSEQQMLLRGAHDTVIATMDHLAVANLLNGDQEKAAKMFMRILQLQRIEYGPHDRRCFITMDKINMVASQGTNFEEAIEELRKTFSMPMAERPANSVAGSTSVASGANRKHQLSRRGQPPLAPKSKTQKNKVLKVLTSMRKKKGASSR